MNVLLVSLTVLVGLLVVLEVGLRLLVGFGNPLLYLGDEEIGYLLAPNQRTRRFGNRIAINEYSMRSPTITTDVPASTLRVLLLGDSVANGAWWTDQEQTISALVTAQLELAVREASGKVEDASPWEKGKGKREKEQSSFSPLPLIPKGAREFPFPPSPSLENKESHQTLVERVEVLNASANSWGPQNELAYLKRFGTFEARAVVLLLNTDDLFAAAPTKEPVGRDRNYPNRKPSSALAEVFNRYLLPKLPLPVREAIDKLSSISDRLYSFKEGYSPQTATLGETLNANRATSEPGFSQGETPLLALAQRETEASKDDPLDFNLDAICQIQTLAEAAGAEFLLAMTPLLREIGEPGPRDYELVARARLTELTQNQQISYLDFLAVFNRLEMPRSLYRDHIHLSPLGNRMVSEAIARSLQQLLHLPLRLPLPPLI